MVRAFAGISLGCVTAATAFAANAPMSLYGVTVGEPLSIQSCEISRASMCWLPAPENVAEVTPAGMTARQVNFSIESQPTIARYPAFQIMLIDGVVEEITMFTRGLDVQDEVLRQLIEKFGQPSYQEVESVLNRQGTRFDYIVAHWRASDTTVKFTGVLGTLDSGLISATSPRAAEKYLEASKNRRAAEVTVKRSAE